MIINCLYNTKTRMLEYSQINETILQLILRLAIYNQTYKLCPESYAIEQLFGRRTLQTRQKRIG